MYAQMTERIGNWERLSSGNWVPLLACPAVKQRSAKYTAGQASSGTLREIRKANVSHFVFVCSVFVGVALVCGSAVRAAEPVVAAQLGSAQVHLGESVRYRVVLKNVEDSIRPVLNGFDDFEVAYLGERSSSSRSITIINGRRTDNVTVTWHYDYDLTPTRAGTLTIPAPVVQIDGNDHTGNTLAIRVIAPQQQDIAIPVITVSPVSVYPTQPFTVTLTIAVKELPREFGEMSPIEVLHQLSVVPPELSVPWFDDDRVPNGLTPRESLNEALQSALQRRRGGFRINNIGQQSVFSLFGSQAAQFHPEPESVRRADDDGNQADYLEYAFERSFFSDTPGELRFGPVSLKGVFVTGLRDNKATVDEVYAIATPTTVTVIPIPTQGRPDTWIGAVGEFRFDAQLNPTEAHVGQPLTLILTLTGSGTLDQAFAPDLTQHADISRNFRVYDGTEETKGNTRQFTYSLRPSNADLDSLPPIAVSWFDVERGCYVTVQSERIPLRIMQSDALASGEILLAPGGQGSQPANQKRTDGIFANDTDLRSVRNESVYPFRWVSAWMGIVVASVITSLTVRRVRRRREDAGLMRRRSAAARARARLRAAVERGRTDRESHADEIRLAVTGLVAAVRDEPEDALAARDVHRLLLQLEVPTDLSDRVYGLLERCDAARYGTLGNDGAPLRGESQRLLDELIGELKQRKLLS